MPDLRYLRLPGISTRDPNFYEGADYDDRDRFAAPVKDGRLDPRVDREGTSLGGEQPPSFDEQMPSTATERSPFRLGGSR